MSASFAAECTESKKQYDDCFNKWYSEVFLKGGDNKDSCVDSWLTYNHCVKKALVDRKIQPMLDDARNDAPFADAGVVKGTENDGTLEQELKEYRAKQLKR